MFLFRKKNEKIHPILFRNVSLFPSIRALSVSIVKGSWVILSGSDSLGIALFCDLCFGFLEPDSGNISDSYQSHDVGFLGRSSTTYGRTLLEHIQFSVSNTSKEEIHKISHSILGEKFLNLYQPIATLPLKERDYLELAEINFLLQKKSAIVIDTTSEFYQKARNQGFQHSKLLLESGKTIFWICSKREEFPIQHMQKYNVSTTDLFFSLAPHGGGIN